MKLQALMKCQIYKNKPPITVDLVRLVLDLVDDRLYALWLPCASAP